MILCVSVVQFVLFSETFKKKNKLKMVTLEDLRGDSPAFNGSFNKIRDKARAIAKNEDEVDTLMTQRILKNFIKFNAKKTRERRQRLLEKERTKKTVVKFIRTKKPDAFTTVTTMPKSKRCFSEIDNNDEQPKEVKEQSKKRRGMELRMIPDMPPEFKDKIMELKGSDVNLVIQKVLFDTDLSSHQDRLAIPSRQMKAEFLTEEEQVKLDEKEEDGKRCKGIEVPLIEPSLENSSIKLKKWKLGHNNTYVLSSPWKHVVARNKFISGDIIQLWSFRVHQKPHFALVKIDN